MTWQQHMTVGVSTLQVAPHVGAALLLNTSILFLRKRYKMCQGVAENAPLALATTTT